MKNPELLEEFFKKNILPNNLPDKRMDWNDYFLSIAALTALRSTCIRRKYGAIIVKEHRIVSTGYNGSAPGKDHCFDKGCWREANNIPHGQRYEACVSIHGEQNAIIRCDPKEMKDSDIYIVGFDCKEEKFIAGIPCDICSKMLANSGITNVITRENGLDGQLIVIKC